MTILIQDLSYELRTDSGYVELVIANPAATFQHDRELTFRVDREQVRELSAAFAKLDKAFEDWEAEQRAREAGMTFAERVALRLRQQQEARAEQREFEKTLCGVQQ